MDDNRRAEVNRMLAEFEFPDAIEDSRMLSCLEANDYCGNLSAISRLEMQLPLHDWHIYYHDAAGFVGVTLHWLKKVSNDVTVGEPTEAECRAEAIARYLTARAVEKD